MAYYHARAGVCRVGATYSGLVDRPFDVRVGSTSRKSDVQYRSPWSISEYLDGQPSSARVVVKGTAPTMWQDLIFRSGGATTDVLWGGTITSLQALVLGPSLAYWSVEATGWTWRMDLHARVTATYRSLSVNTILARILRDFTDSADAFQVGCCPDSLGTISEIQFTDETVSSAISRLAKAANAYWRVRPNKRVDIAQTFPQPATLSVGNTTKARELRWESLGSQVRTRTFVKGGGAQTTAKVAVAATTIPVAETGWYSGSGGKVRAGVNTVTYTGRSVTSGPGSLTGCSGIATAIGQGEAVYVLAQADDSAAQTALATALGGGHSGVAVAAFADGRVSHAEADARADNDVAFFRAALPSVSFATDNRFYRVGAILTASVTAPITISGDFRVQSVVISPRDNCASKNPIIQHSVQGRLARRSNLLDVIARR